MQSATAANAADARQAIAERLGDLIQLPMLLADAEGINGLFEYDCEPKTRRGLPVVASLQEVDDVLAARGFRAAADVQGRQAQYLQNNGHSKES